MGQKYAAYDAQGNITAFYDSTDSPVPASVTNVVEITDFQWSTCVGQPGQWSVASGALAQVPLPTAAQQLAAAQAAQNATLRVAYNAAIQQQVSFTTVGGIAKTFQADASSQTILMQATQGYVLTGSVPSGFYWVSSDNTKVPFALEDLKSLYAAMLAQGWTSFQQLQTLKAQVNAATTPAAVQAVAW